MKPDRWDRVERLYHSARKMHAEERAVFLQQECEDDQLLREEVESLLFYDCSAADFIELPAFELAARRMAKDRLPQAHNVSEENANVGRFRLVERLGAGGMGVVYKAQDTKLRRAVALKFLPPELSRDPQALARFQSEAFTASALNHPNICTVYDVDEYQGQPFIAMELLEGQTLDSRIGTNALPTSELLDLAIQISEALGAAHARGIIHRDIKPSNIFVTAVGRPKILDFGLAKLQESELPRTRDLQSNVAQGKSEHTDPNLTLTRTGVAIGTAGYMSPEQIRGEHLDVRTDLFSFGLVLYQMATGQRAFKGGTGPELHNAILEHAPTPAQQLNPELPAKLVNIINKTLRKDRAARYQSVTEIRADLETLKRETELRRPFRPWVLAVGITVVLLAISTSLWLAGRKPSPSQTVPEVKLRQLTVNSFENRVTSGAISPDGKYLAYADVNGMYIKDTQTGETRAVPEPKGLNIKNLQWEIGSSFSPAAVWFPDSAGFVANAHPMSQDPGLWSSEDTSIWLVSASGGAPRKLRDKAVAYAVSPVGSLVLFATNEGRDVWVMGPSGEQARRISDVPSPIVAMFWTGDGRRIVYARGNQAGGVTVLSRGLEGGPEVPIPALSEMKDIDDVSAWLPDGRLLYSVRESGDLPDRCNFWTMRLNARTGQLIEGPKRLTNWTGSCMSYASATADGKNLVFLKGLGHLTSYIADLRASGARITNLRHFPLSESSDGIADWIDSKEVLNVSNRAGVFGIFKQRLNEETAEPLVTEGYGGNPRVTPDGRWILYLGAGKNGEPLWTTPLPVMRVPISGGRSQQLFTARPMRIMDCARSSLGPCVIAEPSEDHKQLVVSSLDALKGRGPELFTFALDPNSDGWFWYALSPEGTRIAATREQTGPIYVLSLQGRPIQHIKVKGWTNLLEFTWAADGRGLYVISSTQGKHVLLYVDLQGNAHALWENIGASGETLALPSPDGHHLAIQSWITNGNMWMMENF